MFSHLVEGISSLFKFMMWVIGILALIVVLLVCLFFYNHKKAQHPVITGKIIEISANNLLNPTFVGVKIETFADRSKKSGVIRETIEFELDPTYNKAFIDQRKELIGKTIKFQKNKRDSWTPGPIPIITPDGQ